MNLPRLLLVNAVFNALGGFILLFGVNQLDSWLHLNSDSDFLWHLLAACSLSLAALSFCAIKFKEQASIRAAALTFMIFNGLSAIVGIWAIADGINHLVWINTAVHAVFFILFLYYGLLHSETGLPVKRSIQ